MTEAGRDGGPTPARVVVTRGGLVESVHRIHAAVVDAEGRLVAAVGDVRRATYVRSAAKPFQALPLVDDGVADRFDLTGSELALCCASHNAEDRHLAAARSILRRAGLEEGDLACGPHPPLRREEAERIAASGMKPSAVHNNCSGKHAGMLAFAVHRGWPTAGYHRETHPVQRRMLAEVARWTATPEEDVVTGVDGCGVVCFAVPLAAAAGAFARLGAAARAGEPGPATVVEAMTAHPFMVAGTGRLCTVLMQAAGGAVVAKTGAEGVYGAAVPERGLGIALKVEDGGKRASEPALVAVLDALGVLDAGASEALASFRRPPVLNTRGEEVGEVRIELDLEDASSSVRRRA